MQSNFKHDVACKSHRNEIVKMLISYKHVWLLLFDTTIICGYADAMSKNIDNIDHVDIIIDNIDYVYVMQNRKHNLFAGCNAAYAPVKTNPK